MKQRGNKVLRTLKKIWILNFIRRIYLASKYYNYKYYQILRWGLSSKEDTNFTFTLTETNILYLAHTIAVVTRSKMESIYEYIQELQNDDELKSHIILTTNQSGFKHIADKSADFGRRLGWYAFVRTLKPKVVVETGVDKGLGSVVLCAALKKNMQEGFPGEYFGTDINPEAGYLLTAQYSVFGRILYGDSIDTLKKLNKQIDLFINDSDHSADYEYQEYKTIQDKLSDGAIILGDNSHCTDKLAQFSGETGRQFLFFHEVPFNHWYPGSGIGISYRN